ncbi:MAG: cell wall hydrolase [Firmicutes bacterium]|nr:cell wall hydrolase [Bacillota bacterium]
MSWVLLLALVFISGCFSNVPETIPTHQVGFWVENTQNDNEFIVLPKSMYQIWHKGSTIKVTAYGCFSYEGVSQDIITLVPDPEFWLASVIWAEARGESTEGQAAVGQVILNRVKDPRFNNSIVDVVFESTKSRTGRSIYQFSPIIDGQIFLAFRDSNFKAFETIARNLTANLMINPQLTKALGFFNPVKVQAYDPNKTNWVWKQPVLTQIGSHVFFSVP